MTLLLVGLSHKTAPIDIREKIHFPQTRLYEALQTLTSESTIEEGLILSTCNRIEIVTHAADTTRGLDVVMEFISKFHCLPKEFIHPFLYNFAQADVVRHVFRVASSLDSMVVGEPQILGQFKTAFNQASSVGTVGNTLSPLMHRAFHVAKRVRSETGISNSAVSVSYAAVELAKKIFDKLTGRTVLLLGAGKMSELSAKHLSSQGVKHLLVWNRTYQRAIEMASKLHGEAIHPEELFRHIERADILICSTGSPDVILKKSDAQKLVQLRRNKPVFIIDIAVPRDVDPELNKLNNIFLYDIDDLRHVVDANLKHRQKEALLAERIIHDEVQSYINQIQNLEIVPSIVSLRQHWDSVRQEELAKSRKRFGKLTPDQEAALESLTQRIINKILHGPVSEIKSLGQDPSAKQRIKAIKRMFGVKD